MWDVHKQWASMSSVDGSDEPTSTLISSKVSRTKSRHENDIEEAAHEHGLSGRVSESSFVVQDDIDKALLTWSNLYVDVQGDKKESKSHKFCSKVFHCCKKSDSTNTNNGGSSLPYKNMISRKRILKNVTGYAKPGRILAIMGASGSGKTTLLNVLTHRNTSDLRIEGFIKLNGRPISQNQIRSISAYVQQDDLFIGTLKVKEHLQFQAALRLGDSASREKKRETVRRVLMELGLTKCANTMIGVKNEIKGISGGERKRLAFASEILTNPALMFCDEPTSGLDSFMAQHVIAVLKNMAGKGKTIICTIHQPSSQVFKYFDDICLLSEGRVAYMGPLSEAMFLFEKAGFPCPQNFNPADHYIRTLAIEPGKSAEGKQKTRKIITTFVQSDTYKKVQRAVSVGWKDDEISLPDSEKKPKKTYNASWCTQFGTLFHRCLLQNAREPLLASVRLFQTTLIAILYGLLYFKTQISSETIQNLNGLLFMFPIQTSFSFTFAVVHVFCEEIPIFLREHFSNLYRVDAYYLAKIITDLPQFIIFPAIFCTLVYFMAGLTSDPSVFLILLGICILTTNVGVSIGYCVSAAFIDLNTATSITPILIIPFMIFAGFYVNVDTVPVYFSWLQYLSFLKYSYQAVAINQWQSVSNIPGCENYTCPHNGTAVLETLHFNPGSFDSCVIALVVMFVVLRFTAFLFLLIRTYVRT